MPQVFSSRMNIVATTSAVMAPLAAAALLWAGLVYTQSSFGTGAGQTIVQPIAQFSHQHHAGVLGIDCRYCHTQSSTPRSPAFRRQRPA